MNKPNVGRGEEDYKSIKAIREISTLDNKSFSDFQAAITDFIEKNETDCGNRPRSWAKDHWKFLIAQFLKSRSNGSRIFSKTREGFSAKSCLSMDEDLDDIAFLSFVLMKLTIPKVNKKRKGCAKEDDDSADSPAPKKSKVMTPSKTASANKDDVAVVVKVNEPPTSSQKASVAAATSTKKGDFAKKIMEAGDSVDGNDDDGSQTGAVNKTPAVSKDASEIGADDAVHDEEARAEDHADGEQSDAERVLAEPSKAQTVEQDKTDEQDKADEEVTAEGQVSTDDQGKADEQVKARKHKDLMRAIKECTPTQRKKTVEDLDQAELARLKEAAFAGNEAALAFINDAEDGAAEAKTGRDIDNDTTMEDAPVANSANGTLAEGAKLALCVSTAPVNGAETFMLSVPASADFASLVGRIYLKGSTQHRDGMKSAAKIRFGFGGIVPDRWLVIEEAEVDREIMWQRIAQHLVFCAQEKGLATVDVSFE